MAQFSGDGIVVIVIIVIDKAVGLELHHLFTACVIDAIGTVLILVNAGH